jgi:hypothetical protein
MSGLNILAQREVPHITDVGVIFNHTLYGNSGDIDWKKPLCLHLQEIGDTCLQPCNLVKMYEDFHISNIPIQLHEISSWFGDLIKLLGDNYSETQVKVSIEQYCQIFGHLLTTLLAIQGSDETIQTCIMQYLTTLFQYNIVTSLNHVETMVQQLLGKLKSNTTSYRLPEFCFVANVLKFTVVVLKVSGEGQTDDLNKMVVDNPLKNIFSYCQNNTSIE